MLAAALVAGTAGAEAAPRLGAATGFAALAGATVTSTGTTAIFGDLGVAPRTAITGLASLTLTGGLHAADAAALQAQADAVAAFSALAAGPFGTDLTGLDMGSVGVLAPGIYSFASSAQLTGDLVLDFGGAAGDFVFLIGSTLTTASASSVTAINGTADSGIYFVVGSSATLGTGTTFAGNILAAQSITLNTGASILCGRAIALIASLTLDGNRISNRCEGGGTLDGGRSDFGSGGFDRAPGDAIVPEPATWAMLIAGFALVGVAVRRHRVAAA